MVKTKNIKQCIMIIHNNILISDGVNMFKYLSNAQWIGLGEGNHKVSEVSPALQFRKIFNISKIETTHCAVCGLGCFVLYINGKRVGKDVLTPNFTAYDKRAYYSVYDVTEYLTVGENVVAVKVGDGFYNQTTKDGWHFYEASWRNAKKLCLELVSNGNVLCTTDGSWKCTDSGATYHSAIRMGEYFDARLDDGWQNVNYDYTSWYNAEIVRPCGGVLEREIMPYAREKKTFTAKTFWQSKNGYVYDFGTNITGYARIQLKGIAGQTLKIRYAEKLRGKEIDQRNLFLYVETDSFSQDRYTFKGEGVETFSPDFCYHGFRYVEISGCEITPDINSVLGIFVHTDMPKIGEFNSSNDLLNWICDASVQALLNNFMGILQDCPHREKNGWTGDAACSVKYACYNFDARTSFIKIIKDVCDTQRPNGQICCIAPTSGWGYNWGTGPAWDCVLFYVPYALYNQYLDTECIEYVYPYAKKYLQFVQSLETDYTVDFGIGDWRPPMKITGRKSVGNRFLDTCYYLSMLRIATFMADIVGEKADGESFSNRAKKVHKAILDKFVDGTNVDNGSQGAMALALYFDILDVPSSRLVAKKLVQELQECDFTFNVGLLGLNALLYGLSKYGYKDVAYNVVTRKKYPSYNYQRQKGATALWESWEGDVSLNHHMYGYVNHWINENVAGLRLIESGYAKCAIEPFFFAKDCFASTKTKTPFGEISVSWKKTLDTLSIDLIIPEKSDCELILPKGKARVTSGHYEFKL